MPYSSFVVCQDVQISLGWTGTDFLNKFAIYKSVLNPKLFETRRFWSPDLQELLEYEGGIGGGGFFEQTRLHTLMWSNNGFQKKEVTDAKV